MSETAQRPKRDSRHLSMFLRFYVSFYVSFMSKTLLRGNSILRKSCESEPRTKTLCLVAISAASYRDSSQLQFTGMHLLTTRRALGYAILADIH